MSYVIENGKFVELTKFRKFKFKFKRFFTKWKIVNKYRNNIIPYSDMKLYFRLSEKQYKQAKEIYKEKGSISYEFYPLAGLGYGLKIHVLKTNEIINITDVSTW